MAAYVTPELRVIDRRGRLDEEKTSDFKELMYERSDQ